MTKKSKTPAIAAREEFDTVVNGVAFLQVTLQNLEAERAARIQKIDEEFGPSIETTRQSIKEGVRVAAAFADSHRAELFAKDAKTASTALAQYGFRLGQPKLSLLKKWTWELVAAALRSTKRTHLLRVKEEVDKDALLIVVQTSPKVAWENVGVEVIQGEAFWVEPKTTDDQRDKAVVS